MTPRRLKLDDTSKVAIYTKKTLVEGQNYTIQHQHALANHNSMVLDIIDKGTITLRIINIYHMVPERGHDLHYLLTAHLDDLTPTVIMGDFNTHSPQWSLDNRPASSWG
jgi:endonuclease/exonuclease/phosphatase family metal-dependent hydrolase